MHLLSSDQQQLSFRVSLPSQQSSIVYDCIEWRATTATTTQSRNATFAITAAVYPIRALIVIFSNEKKKQEATFRFHLCNLVISFSEQSLHNFLRFTDDCRGTELKRHCTEGSAERN